LAVAGVVLSDVVVELRGGTGREDAGGKKSKRGVAKLSRQGAKPRSGEEKLERTSASVAAASDVEAGSRRSKLLVAV
jgi:hypothetical protein